jgi:hypothetical protein
MTVLTQEQQVRETPAVVEENENFWRRHYELYKTTGKSRSQYSRDKGINYHRFVYWARKFSRQQPTLVAVKLKEPTTSLIPASLCKLQFRNGCELTLYDLATLSFVLSKMS